MNQIELSVNDVWSFKLHLILLTFKYIIKNTVKTVQKGDLDHYLQVKGIGNSQYLSLRDCFKLVQNVTLQAKVRVLMHVINT